MASWRRQPLSCTLRDVRSPASGERWLQQAGAGLAGGMSSKAGGSGRHLRQRSPSSGVGPSGPGPGSRAAQQGSGRKGPEHVFSASAPRLHPSAACPIAAGFQHRRRFLRSAPGGLEGSRAHTEPSSAPSKPRILFHSCIWVQQTSVGALAARGGLDPGSGWIYGSRCPRRSRTACRPPHRPASRLWGQRSQGWGERGRGAGQPGLGPPRLSAGTWPWQGWACEG